MALVRYASTFFRKWRESRPDIEYENLVNGYLCSCALIVYRNYLSAQDERAVVPVMLWVFGIAEVFVVREESR